MTKRHRRLGILLGLVASCVLPVATAQAGPIGMVCTNGPTFNLDAKSGYIETPDGNSVFNWSYAVHDGHFQEPGPVLCVNQGDTVTVNLHNALAAGAPAGMHAQNVSIVFPGQERVTATGGAAGTFTREATTSGDDVRYTFTASEPGTYLYESGTNTPQQVEMGLYGALVVRPAGHPERAYADPSTAFDTGHEYLIMLNELDPDLHQAVETGGAYDFTQLHNRYFAVNGREFPDTLQDNGVAWLPNQPYGALVRMQPYCNPGASPPDPLNPPTCVTGSTPNRLPALIRMINVGALNHPYHPHGNHLRQIAQDGRPFAAGASSEHFGETIGSGQTEDYLLTWADQDFWDPVANKFPSNSATIDYRNLTFKDDNTYFSGSAYLGLKGTLPTGTVQQNVCGEWYFPWHSHALNEFTNFDQGFGGMATLMRIDPLGGCFAYPTAVTISNGALMGGSYSALAADDATYYQVKPKATTLAVNMTAAQSTMTVASVSGFSGSPTTFPFYVRVQNEVVRVNSVAASPVNTWNVTRGQFGTVAASHTAGSAQTVTSLSDDWYAGFSGVAAGSGNLKLTYKGKNCANTAAATPPCTTLANPIPQQTVKICNWTVAGANGCSSATSSGWVALTPSQSVGSNDVSTTWTPTGAASNYIGTGANRGQVRVLVHTDRWALTNPTPFSTWGNLMKLVYDAP